MFRCAGLCLTGCAAVWDSVDWTTYPCYGNAVPRCKQQLTMTAGMMWAGPARAVALLSPPSLGTSTAALAHSALAYFHCHFRHSVLRLSHFSNGWGLWISLRNGCTEKCIYIKRFSYENMAGMQSSPTIELPVLPPWWWYQAGSSSGGPGLCWIWSPESYELPVFTVNLQITKKFTLFYCMFPFFPCRKVILIYQVH